MKTRIVCMLAVVLLAEVTAGEELALKASSAVLTGAFALTNGCIWQNGKSAGHAVFSFQLDKAGSYAIRATVNASAPKPGSFLVDIDSEPTQLEMTWDLAHTSGFEPHLITWRGNGTAAQPQFRPKVFHLSAGQHQLILQGTEAGAQVQGLAILALPPPPTGLHVVSKP